MNIYIYTQKIDGQFLDISIIAKPIILLEKLRNFLLFTGQIDCSDNKGYINFKHNQAKNHFLIFEKERKKFFNEIGNFCLNKEIFLLNYVDKDELREQEEVFFFKGNKKTKEFIDSLKDNYDIHKANKDIFQMADCLKRAEDIVSGKIKIY